MTPRRTALHLAPLVSWLQLPGGAVRVYPTRRRATHAGRYHIGARRDQRTLDGQR